MSLVPAGLGRLAFLLTAPARPQFFPARIAPCCLNSFHGRYMTIEQKLDRWVAAGAAIAGSLGLASLGGWMLGATAWCGGLPGLYRITPNLALCLMFAGAALFLVGNRRWPVARLAGNVLGLAVAGIATIRHLHNNHWALD